VFTNLSAITELPSNIMLSIENDITGKIMAVTIVKVHAIEFISPS